MSSKDQVVEYRNEMIKNFSVKISANELSEVMQKNLEKNSARVFKDASIYSSNFLGTIDEETLKKEALENKHSKISFNYTLNQNIERQVSAGVQLSDKDLVLRVKNLLDLMKNHLPDFVFSGQVEHETYKKIIKTSLNTNLKSTLSKSEGYFALKKLGSPNIMDNFIEFRFADKDITLGEVQKFIDFHKVWDKEVSISSGRYPVLYIDNSRDFLAKISECLSPQIYHENASIYSGKKDELIFNPRISLKEITKDLEFGILKEFDDEANLCTKDHFIIENGKFMGALYDKASAKKYNTNPTGHSKRNYNSSITTAISDIDFTPGDKDLNKVFSEHKEIVAVFMAGGGDTTANGDYSSPVQLSFLVRDGKIVGKLPDLTISNNINNMLGEDFIDVVNEKVQLTLHHPFMCYMNVLA